MPASRDDVAHLLRRVGFGGTLTEIDSLVVYDRVELVDRVLDTTLARPALPPAALSDAALGNGEKWVAMNAWWLDRMRTSTTPVQEKVTLFWHGHFATSMAKVDHAQPMFDQNQILRSQGMGSLSALARKVSTGPAMLVYLDNFKNRVGSPNENFARELMELFTLGVNQYTQEDVVAVARAWTGHGLTSDRKTYYFDATRHDGGSKTFMGITRAWDGPEVIDEIVHGAGRARCARFIATKAWSFFAHPDPATTVIDALASAYISSGMRFDALLRALFLRDEFWAPRARFALVRSPTELVVAAMKHTGLGPDAAHPDWWMDAMGQRLFYPPDVSGWKPGLGWVDTSSVWARGSFARYLTWRARDAGFLAGSGSLAPADAVQRVFDAFGITSPSPATRAALEAYVRAERGARGLAEEPNLITLGLLCPDFQVA